MDFSSLFPATASALVRFSPGSTFIASVWDSHLVVRTAEDLQLVRAWKLFSQAGSVAQHQIDQLLWSPDGAYLLISAFERGREWSKVFVLDPRSEPNHAHEAGAEDLGGAVAYLEPGPVGMSNAQWGPALAAPTIFTFSPSFEDAGLMTAHCLGDSSAAVFKDVKRDRLWPHPKVKNRFAVLHRNPEEGIESVGIYSYVDSSQGKGAGNTKKEAISYSALVSNHEAACMPPSTGLCSNWRLEARFLTQTNDASGLSWSPDGSLIAVVESALEYKLSLFTPLGFGRGHFTTTANGDLRTRMNHQTPTPSMAASTSRSSSRATTGADYVGDEFSMAEGGLGARAIAWRPLDKWTASAKPILAVGGYDEKVHFLEPAGDHPASADWCVQPDSIIDLSRSVFRSRHNAQVAAHVFREPRDWLRTTGHESIISFHRSSEFPVSVPSMKPDWDRFSTQAGIHWMEWHCSGRLLAIRCGSKPSAVFIYTLASHASSSLELLSILLLAAPVSATQWKPLHESDHGQTSCMAELSISTGSAQEPAFYKWSCRSPSEVLMEGVPVPVEPLAENDSSFSPTHIQYAADGLRMSLTSGHAGEHIKAFCVATMLQDDDEASSIS